MTTPSISCIILAGGEGKRFNNTDKGLADYKGKPFIQHITEHISTQVDDIVISANRNIDRYKKFTAKVIKDTTQDFQGPLAGVSACIPECAHEWILVLPCDIPLLPNNLVTKLMVQNSKLAVAKAYEHRQLVFLMHSSLGENLDEFLKQGHHKAMSWIELQNPAVVTFEGNGNTFLNINTPEDLNKI